MNERCSDFGWLNDPELELLSTKLSTTGSITDEVCVEDIFNLADSLGLPRKHIEQNEDDFNKTTEVLGQFLETRGQSAETRLSAIKSFIDKNPYELQVLSYLQTDQLLDASFHTENNEEERGAIQDCHDFHNFMLSFFIDRLDYILQAQDTKKITLPSQNILKGFLGGYWLFSLSNKGSNEKTRKWKTFSSQSIKLLRDGLVKESPESFLSLINDFDSKGLTSDVLILLSFEIYKVFGKEIDPLVERGISQWLMRIDNLFVDTIGVRTILVQKSFHHLWDIWGRRFRDELKDLSSPITKLLIAFWSVDDFYKKGPSFVKQLFQRKKKEEQVLFHKQKVSFVFSDNTKAREMLDIPHMKDISSQDIQEGKIELSDALSEGSTLCVKISRKSKKGNFSVPPENMSQWSKVVVTSNEDGSFTLPDELGWRGQEGKTFGFEFFVEKGGRRSEYTHRVEVSILKPEKEKPVLSVPKNVQKNVQLCLEHNEARYLMEKEEEEQFILQKESIQSSKDKLMGIVDVKESTIEDYKAAWELVLDEKEVLTRFIKIHIISHNDGEWYSLPFPEEYKELLDDKGVALPDMLHIAYDEGESRFLSNFDGLSDDVRGFLKSLILDKITIKNHLTKQVEEELIAGLGENETGSISTKLASDYEQHRKGKKPKVSFLCIRNGSRFEQIVRDSGDIDSVYVDLEREYGEGNVMVSYRRRLVSFYGIKKQDDINALLDKNDFFDKEAGLKGMEKNISRGVSKEKSDENIDKAFESPEMLEVVAQRLRSHLNILADPRNRRTSLTNGSEEALNTIMQVGKFVNENTPKDEIPTGFSEIAHEDVDHAFAKLFLIEYQRIKGRITFSVPVFTTLEQHKKNVKADIIEQ